MIPAGLSRYSSVWKTFFKESLNLGIAGEPTQHILWRMERLPVLSHLKYVIIHCGTNNISKDSPSKIANSILCIALLKKKKRNPYPKIIITGIFLRDGKFSRFRIIVPQINQLLKIFTSTYDLIDFLEPTKDCSKCNGDFNNKLFWTDHVYLSKFGNKRLTSSIFTLLQQYQIVSKYPKLVPVSSVVCKSFILSFILSVSSCYNVTSVTKVKVCNFFVSSQSVCEVIPIHVNVVHVTTGAILKH